MWTEQRLHEDLHSILDRWEPPVDDRVLTTVLHRGRWRLRTRRASMLGGIAIAVTAIGVGAAMLPAPAPGGTGASATADSAPGTASGTTSGAASSTVSSTGPAPSAPDWTPVPITPPPTAGQPSVCSDTSPPHLPPTAGGIRPEGEVLPAFQSAVTMIAASAQVRRVRPTYWSADDPKTGTPRGFIEVDVTDAGGTGSVQLEVMPLAGTPQQAADGDAYVYSNCVPPQRITLPGGAVLQLYPAMSENTPEPRRTVRIYTPNGHLYVATAAGYGSIHYRPAAGGGERVVGGRGSVPLSVDQLTGLAKALAALG
jgi:hypothetical protein